MNADGGLRAGLIFDAVQGDRGTLFVAKPASRKRGHLSGSKKETILPLHRLIFVRQSVLPHDALNRAAVRNCQAPLGG